SKMCIACLLIFLVICTPFSGASLDQPSDALTLEKLQAEVQADRKHITEALESLKRTLLAEIATSTVPLGFVYVQLPNQAEPEALWPKYKWTEISDDYGDVFFRVQGGSTEAFGKMQEANAG